VATEKRRMKKQSSEMVNLLESQHLKDIMMEQYKLINTHPEKLNKTLMKNLNSVYQSFANMDQNIYNVKSKAEEINDPKLSESAKVIEAEQQNIKNLMTSSFQQMKEFLTALKACQDKDSERKNPIKDSKSENLDILEFQIGPEISPESESENKTEEDKQKTDSDEDTIFYDACDAMILDEIQKEYQRNSILSNTGEETEEIRTNLPALKPEGKFSLLKVLKDAIGRDLTKF
jgi:hypothetical protein